jgi:hypothetical protein
MGAGAYIGRMYTIHQYEDERFSQIMKKTAEACKRYLEYLRRKDGY